MAGPERMTDHGLIRGLGDDDHTHYLNAARHAATSHSFVDHGSLAGLADDDHTHYHTDARHAALTHSFVDHGALSGLGDDDHTQYHTDGRAATWHTGLSGAHVTNGDTHDHSGGDGAQIDHGGLGGLGDDDHTQYARKLTEGAAAPVIIAYDADTNDSPAILGDMLEGGSAFGTAGVYGFRILYDPSSNQLIFRSGNQTTVTDRAVIGRDSGPAWALGRVAYAENTANQTGIGAGTTNLTGLSVTWTAISGRLYRISGFVSDFQRTAGLATDDRHSLDIRNSAGTAYQRAFFTYFNATAGYSGAQYVECLVSGLSGSQTFKLTHSRLSGGATISKRASGSEPSWILVEDIGI